MYTNKGFFFAVTIFLCTVLQAKRETFSTVFKPMTLNYLYELYEQHKEMKSYVDEMFSVKACYNVQKKRRKKVIAYSLFWKAPYTTMAHPMVDRNSIYSKSKAVKGGGSFKNVYLAPLVDQLNKFDTFYPGWIARVYLAADLEFLLPKLMKKNVEIFVMNSNSIAAAPGSMWRFLALGDPSVRVAYVKDADKIWDRQDGNFSQASRIKSFVASKSTKGFFRIRDLGFAVRRLKNGFPWYSPISASSFGAKDVKWLNVEKAMKGYILHRLLFPNEERHPRDPALANHPYGFGHEFPSYGFDESFLKHVIYFEAADRNELTLISTGELLRYGKNLPHGSLPLLDLQYANFNHFE